MTQMAKLLKTMLAVIVVVAMTMVSVGCEKEGTLPDKDHPAGTEQHSDDEHHDDEHPADNKSDSEHPTDEKISSGSEHPADKEHPK